MASGLLKDTYKQYKEDTLTFTTWLSQAAKSCGWKPATQLYASPIPNQDDIAANATKGPRLKGRDRKLARDAAKSVPISNTESVPQTTVKYAITTTELLQQATIVAKAKKSKFPDGVQSVLERAIGLRKRCAAWFRETDQLNKYGSSNEGHQHFIDILEKAAQLLGVTQSQSPDGDKGPILIQNLHREEVDVLR